MNMSIKLLGCFLAFLLWDIALTAQRFASPEELQQLHCHKPEAVFRHFQSTPRSAAGDSYDLGYTRCFWTVDPAVHYIQGHVTTYFTSKVDALTELNFDLSLNMQVDSVRYHGQSLSFTHDTDDALHILLPTPLSAGAQDSVTVFYQGAPVDGQAFGTFITSNHNGTPVLWTLSEPFGALQWWPCKQSLSDKADSIDIQVTVPAGYKVASNGLLQSVTPGPNGQVHHWHSKYPIATYLVAIAVTNYEEYTEYVPYPGGTIPVLNYWYPEFVDQAQTETGVTVEIMQLFNIRAGLYPFYEEKYGHAHFGFGGGMEHQTMSFMIGASYGLIAHELAHQWFGDKVTCGSWQHIWLNEGFATYFEGLSREAYFSPATWYNWKLGKKNNVTAQPGGSVFVPDTTDINRIFSGRLSYNKGAYLLHMLRWMLGDDAFFQGIRNYLNDPKLAFNFAYTADLQAHLEAAGGQDLDRFFDQWFYGEGYPTYTLNWSQNKGFFEGRMTQSTSMPGSVPVFDIPVPIRVYGPDQDSTIVLQPNTAGTAYFSVMMPFPIDSVAIDPDLWILSGQNNVVKLIDAVHAPVVSLGLRVAPNPVADILQVRGTRLPGEGRLRLTDALGRLRMERAVVEQGSPWQQEIDLEAQSNGVYFLQIIGEGWVSETVRVVK